MAYCKVTGTKRDGGDAFATTEAGYGCCIYHNPGPLQNTQDGAFCTILSLKMGEVSGSVQVEFEFVNTLFVNAQSSKARLRMGETTYAEMQTGTVGATYSQRLQVSPGDVIHLEVYCLGANSKTQVRNLRICAIPPKEWVRAV